MTQSELKEIIKQHKEWINNRSEGKKADLWRADLKRADLREANLRRADLRETDLREANLRGADLKGADLGGADLRGADLRRADLREANLRRADLREANLRGANLRGADLKGADLKGATLPHFQIVPEHGSFTCWKKCNKHLVKLLIPKDAKRVSSLVGRKCRASKAKVLEIFDSKGNKTEDTIAYGEYKPNFEYKEGKVVYPDKFDDSILVECSHGIHFFLTKKEALEW